MKRREPADISDLRKIEDFGSLLKEGGSEADGRRKRGAEMNKFRAIFDFAINLLFPRHIKCGLCEIELGQDFPWNLCPECADGLAPVGNYACKGCGRFVGAFALKGFCSHCLGDSPGFSAGVSGYIYNDAAQTIVHGLKYHSKPWLAHSMAAQTVLRVQRLCREWDIQCLVPVPIHETRLKERGYNQAQLLAQELSKYDGIPPVVPLLKRIQDTEPQNKLTRQEREMNVRSAFSINPALLSEGLPRRVLLIDDVLTTGSTLNACAKVLQGQGVEFVAVFTYASVSG